MKFLFFKIILTALLCLTIAAAFPAPASCAEAVRAVRILCYGDSNTYGYDPDPANDRYPVSRRWTGILQDRLGVNFQIIEEGKNGRATGYFPDGRTAAPQEGPEDLTARLEKHQPVDILVIMLGTNDCAPGRGLQAEDIAAGMEALVIAAETWADQNETARPEIVIAAPPATNENILRVSYATQDAEDMYYKTRAIGELYKDIAERHGCLFADARDAEVSGLDCTHLTETGHRQIADLLLDLLSGSACYPLLRG